jgi:hypothetical protein
VLVVRQDDVQPVQREFGEKPFERSLPTDQE